MKLLSRLGLVALWSYAWAAVFLAVYLFMYWMREPSAASFVFWADGIIVLVLAAGLVVRRAYLRVADLVPAPSKLRLTILVQPLLGTVAVLQTFQLAPDSSMAGGALSYVILWHVLQLLPPLLSVVKGGGQPSSHSQYPVKAGAWRVTSSESGAVEVVVRFDRALSLAEAVAEAVRFQALPTLPSGERRWAVQVDGREVGVLTQSWEHPKWWPEVVWARDATEPFEGQRIAFVPTG
ncbi:hypothetical protein AB0A73_28630 [Glycomyces sp. NPDC047369]